MTKKLSKAKKVSESFVLDHVRSIDPYQPGKPVSELCREYGLSENEVVKLASNESPIGPTPEFKKNLKTALKEINRYPDGNSFYLKKTLSKKLNLKVDSILLGNGSNDVLEIISQIFLNENSSAIFSEFGFAVYKLATLARGAEGIEAKADENYGHDLNNILDAIKKNTKIIFIANPNNPTGTWVHPNKIEHFLSSVPKKIIVVLDEAYNEYLPVKFQEIGRRLIESYPNLLVTRSFSKAYGLAGLRVGYAYGDPKLIDFMNRIRQPFNVNLMAQIAAIYALNDKYHLKKAVEINNQGLKQIESTFKKLNLSYIKSYGNFVSFKLRHTMLVYEKFLRKGVILRPLANYKMHEFLRVSIGTKKENQIFADTLNSILNEMNF